MYIFLLEFSAIDAIRILNYVWGTIHLSLYCLFRLVQSIKIMANFDLNAVEKRYRDKTVLAISPRTISQTTAEKMARDLMFKHGARLPPANAKYTIYWFNKKLQRHPIRTFIVCDYPTPPEIEQSHFWEATDLEDFITHARGRYFKRSNR